MMPKLSSTVAFILYSCLLGGGFVFATYNTAAPYLAFSSQITVGFGAYIARRYFNNKLYETLGSKTDGCD
jgi:hypothetical protein